MADQPRGKIGGKRLSKGVTATTDSTTYKSHLRGARLSRSDSHLVASNQATENVIAGRRVTRSSSAQSGHNQDVGQTDPKKPSGRPRQEIQPISLVKPKGRGKKWVSEPDQPDRQRSRNQSFTSCSSAASSSKPAATAAATAPSQNNTRKRRLSATSSISVTSASSTGTGLLLKDFNLRPSTTRKRNISETSTISAFSAHSGGSLIGKPQHTCASKGRGRKYAAKQTQLIVVGKKKVEPQATRATSECTHTAQNSRATFNTECTHTAQNTRASNTECTHTEAGKKAGKRSKRGKRRKSAKSKKKSVDQSSLVPANPSSLVPEVLPRKRSRTSLRSNSYSSISGDSIADNPLFIPTDKPANKKLKGCKTPQPTSTFVPSSSAGSDVTSHSCTTRGLLSKHKPTKKKKVPTATLR